MALDENVADRAVHKPKYVIGTNKGYGFFAAFLVTLGHIDWCERNGFTPVVYWDDQSLFYQPGGYNGSVSNVWEYFFQPVSDLRYVPGDPINRGYLTPDGAFWIGGIFESCFSKDKTNYCQALKLLIDKYVRIKPEVMLKLQSFYRQYMAGKKTIGIHLRGTDKHLEYVSPAPEIILHEANKFSALGYQFLIATDEERLLELAKKSLAGPVIAYNAHRSTNGVPVHVGAGIYGYPAQAGEEVLIEALLLAFCDKLIHTCSNVSMGTLCFNPKIDRIVFAPIPR
jgi:hypothetical protein